jgi:hypothetical protein
MALSLFGAISAATSSSSVKRIETKVANTNAILTVEATVEYFK